MCTTRDAGVLANDVQRSDPAWLLELTGFSRVEDIAGMGTIVLLLLLGWLACTALLTMGVGTRERDGRAHKEVNSPQETSGSPAGID
jgi:hypothetical protein